MAAVLLETVTGANGVLVPPPGYLASIREVCDRHGILLILDEVMTGFGRTGRWFGCEHWDVTPDIMTLAKGISGGAAPLGAVVVSEKLRPWLDEHEFASGLTACGHPLACAAGVATIEAMRDERLVENAAAMGDVLAAELPRARRRSPVGRRGPWPRPALGSRAGARPRDPRAAGALRGGGGGRAADGGPPSGPPWTAAFTSIRTGTC